MSVHTNCEQKYTVYPIPSKRSSFTKKNNNLRKKSGHLEDPSATAEKSGNPQNRGGYHRRVLRAKFQGGHRTARLFAGGGPLGAGEGG